MLVSSLVHCRIYNGLLLWNLFLVRALNLSFLFVRSSLFSFFRFDINASGILFLLFFFSYVFSSRCSFLSLICLGVSCTYLRSPTLRWKVQRRLFFQCYFFSVSAKSLMVSRVRYVLLFGRICSYLIFYFCHVQFYDRPLSSDIGLLDRGPI